MAEAVCTVASVDGAAVAEGVAVVDGETVVDGVAVVDGATVAVGVAEGAVVSVPSAKTATAPYRQKAHTNANRDTVIRLRYFTIILSFIILSLGNC